MGQIALVAIIWNMQQSFLFSRWKDLSPPVVGGSLSNLVCLPGDGRAYRPPTHLSTICKSSEERNTCSQFWTVFCVPMLYGVWIVSLNLLLSHSIVEKYKILDCQLVPFSSFKHVSQLITKCKWETYEQLLQKSHEKIMQRELGEELDLMSTRAHVRCRAPVDFSNSHKSMSETQLGVNIWSCAWAKKQKQKNPRRGQGGGE